MDIFEVEIEMRVRRTLRIAAPNAGMARGAAVGLLQLAAATEIGDGLSAYLKWSDGRTAFRPMPVEEVVFDPPPVILSTALVSRTPPGEGRDG